MSRFRALHLNGLHAVEVVARRGSLLAAAEELGVSPSAVSQQIGRAEKQIGRALFDRTRSGLALTEFGALFASRLTLGFNELKQAVALADESAANTLVASVGPAFASRWLVPRLSLLYVRHPELILRIDASTRLVDIALSDVDFAIRLGAGHWPGATAELLMGQDIFPVCAPAIAKRLKKIEDLASEWGIHHEGSDITWERWFETTNRPKIAPLPGARFSDPILSLEAAIGGQGVMLAWPVLVAEALRDGRLAAPFGVQGWQGLGYFFVTATGRRLPKKVSMFKRWIGEEASRTMSEFDLRIRSAALLRKRH